MTAISGYMMSTTHLQQGIVISRDEPELGTTWTGA